MGSKHGAKSGDEHLMCAAHSGSAVLCEVPCVFELVSHGQRIAGANHIDIPIGFDGSEPTPHWRGCAAGLVVIVTADYNQQVRRAARYFNPRQDEIEARVRA